MTFKEAISKVPWRDVEKFMVDYYTIDIASEDIPHYQHIFNQLHFMTPVETTMRLCLSRVTEDVLDIDKDDFEPYVDIYGKNGTLNKESSDYEHFKDNVTDEFAQSESTYALEFTPWDQWLYMTIDEDTINNFSLVEIVSHSLFEMTYCGYDQKDIQARLDELHKTVDEINNMSEDEKKKRFISFDDILGDDLK